MKAYAIKDTRDGIIDFSTLANKSTDSKLIFCNTDKWKYWYSIGYRCVPVEITEIKPKPLSGEPLKALHKAIKASAKKSTELKDRK